MQLSTHHSHEITVGLEHTSKNEVRSPAIPEKWENISEKTPKRLHNPRNGSDSFVNLCLRWLHLLNIFHVILGSKSTTDIALQENTKHQTKKAVFVIIKTGFKEKLNRVEQILVRETLV